MRKLETGELVPCQAGAILSELHGLILSNPILLAGRSHMHARM